MADSRHHGPHALLVKDAFFCPLDLGHHDYLTIPEIVDDICMCYEESFGHPPLRALFNRAATPCIVKFSSAPGECALSNALLYAHSILQGGGVKGFRPLSFFVGGTSGGCGADFSGRARERLAAQPGHGPDRPKTERWSMPKSLAVRNRNSGGVFCVPGPS